jgi:hypothetical protein
MNYTHSSGALVGDPDLVCARQEKEKQPRRKLSSRYLNYIGRSAQKVYLLLLL